MDSPEPLLRPRLPREQPPAPAVTAPLPTRSRRRRWWLLAAVLLLLAAAAGVWYWQPWSRATPAQAYATAAVKRGTIEDAVGALGNIQPLDYVDVGTQVSGQLKVIHVVIGQGVAKGDLLAEIDPTVYQTRVDADHAQLDNLHAQLDEKQARLTQAQQALERQQNLRRANATSAELLEQAQADLLATRAQIAALNAQIGQTESQLKGDQANLGYTRIYAPMTGTVVSVSARQGQTLNANQSAPIVLRIADLAKVTVTTQVSEADVSRLKLGQEVYFSTLGDPDRRYTGSLRQILPTPEIVSNVVLYDALFDVPNPEGRLMTQMTAQVFFVVARAENVLTIPASALRGERAAADGEAASVLVVKPDGSLDRRKVGIGVTTRTLAEVKAGLAEGEQVVTGPAVPPTGQRPAGAPGQGGGPGGQGPQFRARLG